MKKLNFVVLFMILAIFLKSQDTKKWIVVKDDQEKIIYIDAKNLREVDNQITAWVMTLNKNLKDTDEMGRKIGKVKIQYLFNTISRKYSEEGSIIYDEIGRMIKNNTEAEINAIRQPKVVKFINLDPEIELVYLKSLELLGKQDKVALVTNNNEEVNTDSSKAENNEIPPAIPVVDQDKGEKDISQNIDENNNIKDEKKTPLSTKTEESASVNYDAGKERKVKGVIFTDGKLFVVQKSSWREKIKAEAEVNKLKVKGENAFITEVEIPSKGGTWYRVRIGYFQTLEEAEKK